MTAGRAWVFGDDIDTDIITPGRYNLGTNPDDLKKACFIEHRPDFAKTVRPGDYIVAGRSFGIGSSRESAALSPKLLGVRAILARSFGRIYFRNCVNLGIPPLQGDTSRIRDGDELEVDVATGLVRNVTRAEEYPFRPLGGFVQAVLAEGGLAPYVRKHRRLAP
ncbi:MAG: 3-isopropylmalate dehydratase small subunit [Methanobacteriota archaeon]